jgi:hypothetical protein
MSSSGNQTATPLPSIAVSAARVWTRRNPCSRTARSPSLGRAEVGRELGDAGGPLLVAGIATATSLTGGILGLAALLTLTAIATTVRQRARPDPHR